jgi:hypothetical protein
LRRVSAILFLSETEGDAGDEGGSVAGCAVDAGDDRRIRCDGGFAVVLRLVIVAIEDVVDGEVKLDASADTTGDGEVEDGVAGSHGHWLGW